MNRKFLLAIFGVAALVVSIIIMIVVDPVSARFSQSLVKFQQSQNIFVNTPLNSNLKGKVDELIESL